MTPSHQPLTLRAGDLVEVRSADEILETLDSTGALDNLPFMPEMLSYCGQRFRVAKRADKTCDTISYTGSRRMLHTVHLEDLRCNGAAHGHCQAQCTLFWKEAWLRRVDEHVPARAPQPRTTDLRASPPHPAGCDPSILLKNTRQLGPQPSADPPYRCQATELLRASTPLHWLDLRQYMRDVRSRNVRIRDVLGAVLFRLFEVLLKVGGYRALLWSYNRFQAWRGGTPYPYVTGTLEKTPRQTLDLRPGELAQVKSHAEILKTVNRRNRNHGLSFDPEMVRYCGSVRRVVARVERIIDERTGRMINLSRDCVILDGAVCCAEYSPRRLFCPRSLYPFWREIWLERVSGDGSAVVSNEQRDHVHD